MRQEVLRLARDAESCAAIIAGLESAGRRDLLELLVALVEVAPLEQKRRGLAIMAQSGAVGHAAALELARRLTGHPDASLRAEAVAVLGALAPDQPAVEEIAAALEDPSRRVRQRAAEALARHGDAAIEPAAARLRLARPEVAETAIWALARIGSRRARDALVDLLQPIYARAARNLEWLQRLPADRDRSAWAPFEAAVDDQNRRIFATVMQLLGGLGEGRLVGSLRRALATTDQRTRANALEAMISLPHRGFVLPILPLLETVLLRHEPRQAGTSGSVPPEEAELLREAIGSGDPWIRLGASCTARAIGLAGGAAVASTASGAAASRARRPPTEPDMEQVLFLKRVPLLRHLPLDTLLAVSRSLERHTYLTGEVICEAGAPADHFCIVASGAVDIRGPDGPVERLRGSDYFGELALVEEAPRSPRVVAAEDCSLLRLHRLIFQDLSWEHPDIVMELCRLLARRLRQVQAQPSAGAEAQIDPSGRAEA